MTDIEPREDDVEVACTRCGQPGADPETGVHDPFWECGPTADEINLDRKQRLRQAAAFALGAVVGMIIMGVYR